MTAPLVRYNKKHTLDDRKRVLTKAFIRMSERLHFTRQELAAIIGLSEATLSRIFKQSTYSLDPASNDGQLALLLLRLYRSLDTLFGGNASQCELWLRNENTHLTGIPIKIIQSIEGLILTIQYLDAMRGKI